jgi:hypothetical protein
MEQSQNAQQPQHHSDHHDCIQDGLNSLTPATLVVQDNA